MSTCPRSLSGRHIYRVNGYCACGLREGVVLDGPRDGATFEAARDEARLNAQQQRVYAVVRDGAWRTLSAIAALAGDPEASVSARLRDLRKPRFGNYQVERRNAGGGTWEYRVLPPAA